MPINANGYALIGLTGIVACLVAILTFALLRFVSAARETRQQNRTSGGEVAILSAALHEAVTKLKAQERATAARADASERLSEEIIASLTSGLLVVDLSGVVRTLNPAGRRMLELPEPLTGDNGNGDAGAEPYMRTPREAPLMAVVDECLKNGAAIVRRTVNLPAVGRGVHLGVSVSPIFDGQGRLHGAICLFTDLTAVKDLEAQLRLKDSLATVGELTAGIAHEFRNGLATIQGYSKLFDLDTLPSAYRPYVEGIRAETESLSQVVTNFLNFARPAELVLARVDLRAICERAADEIRPEVTALGGDVRVTGDFGTVEGDEVLLRQAFSNLLRNALEACSGASVMPMVTIESETDEVHRLSRISVQDNGPGIPPASRDRVFQPFFTSKRNGTGLGLALVQKIIVFHNGRINIDRAASGGASFQITLPRAG
jgi:PAS domain S-box-containing protein